MIPMYCLNYSNDLDFKVTRFVNDILLDILKFLVEFGFAKSLVPKGCYRNENFNLENKIREVKEILQDNALREGQISLCPVNESIVYELVLTVIEMEKERETICEINIPDKLKLKMEKYDEYYSYKEVENSDEEIRYNFIIESVLDLNEYLNFLFQDWDFNKNTVNEATSCFLRDPEKFKMMDVDLDYLIKAQEIMSTDLYYEFKQRISMKRNSEVSSAQAITNIIGVQNNMQDNACIDSQVNAKKNSEINSGEKKNFFERHGLLAAIIGAVAVIIGTVLTIIYG